MNDKEDIKLKTFIRWIGNKTKYLKHILPYLPENFNTYIEPFIGSGSLFLTIKPKKWIINDLNKDLINVWINIKNNPDIIIQLFKLFEKDFIHLSKRDQIDYCRKITYEIENIEYDVIRASLYMLMKYCVYMGNLFINNKLYFKGLDLNISTYNRYFFFEEKNYDNLNNVSKFLNSGNGKIFNKDYKEILKNAKYDDFVFLDPPYIEDYDYDLKYNNNENLNEFLKELYLELKKLDKKRVKWMMTQADTMEIKNLFKEYSITKFQVYRGYNKQYKNELIIKNY